jgi:hypothetical protein
MTFAHFEPMLPQNSIYDFNGLASSLPGIVQGFRAYE